MMQYYICHKRMNVSDPGFVLVAAASRGSVAKWAQHEANSDNFVLSYFLFHMNTYGG